MNSLTNETLNQPWVREYLTQPLIARMATCDPHTLQPHVVPVWYEWDGESIWISTFRSTRKVRELKKNPLISIVIDTDARGEAARAVLLEGAAELMFDAPLVRRYAESIYTRYMGPEGVLEAEPQSWLDDAENMLIKLTPTRAQVWGG